MGEGEGEVHGVVFDLADLTEGEELDLIDAGVGVGNMAKGLDVVLVVVKGGDDDLTQGGGDVASI